MFERLSYPNQFERKTARALGTLWGTVQFTSDYIFIQMMTMSPFSATKHQVETTITVGPSLKDLLGCAWTEKTITEATRVFGVDLTQYFAVDQKPQNIATARYIKIDNDPQTIPLYFDGIVAILAKNPIKPTS